MWLKSYKWNMIPHTVYEIRREMRVRESRHTAMLFDKKYYDCESGKYISDKLCTINSYSLNEMVVCESEYTRDYLNECDRYRKNKYSPTKKWFTPLDDDFI